MPVHIVENAISFFERALFHLDEIVVPGWGPLSKKILLRFAFAQRYREIISRTM